MSVRKGEIVGIAGLIGSGQRDLANVIFGSKKYDSGEIYFENKKYKPSPQNSVKKGIGFLTESRKFDGLFLGHSIRHNASIASLKMFVNSFFIDSKKERKIIKEIVENLALKYDSLDKEVQFLSGGNQQKVVIAKWLCCDSKILIFNEPTRGIDIGARYDIYKLMFTLASKGVAIIVISTDLKEIIGVCDRICIIRNGKILGELENKDLSEESLLLHAAGGSL